jgi:hypothetical protein
MEVSLSRFILWMAVAFLPVTFSAQGAAIAGGDIVELSPHKAVYDMRLGRVRSGADVAGAKGSLVMEWVKSCAGWTVKQRVRLRLINNEGRSIDTDANFSSFESLDGLSYRFTARNTRSGAVTEDIRGNARIKEKGGAGSADFTSPKGIRYDLPKGAIFPTEHAIHLIRGARLGKSQVFRLVFDGATDDGPLEVNAFIFGHLPKASARWAKRKLTNRPSWYLRLAFFPAAKSKALPEYELGLRLFDNGVADDFELDYGSFTVNAVLKSIEALSKPKC